MVASSVALMITAAALRERPGHPREALAALRAGVDAAATAPLWRCIDGEVAEAVADLDREASRVDAARLRLLTEADQRGIAAAAGATSTAQWYAHTTTSRRQHAGHRVALARSVNGPLAATGAVLATGGITGDHAAVIHRVMTALPIALDAETRERAEGFLLEQALTHDPAQLAFLGTALRHAVTGDDGHRADREETRAIGAEGVTLVRDDDGRWHLRGVLAPESGVRLRTALDALSAPGSAHAGARDGRPACQRRAQALTHLADTWLSGHPGDGPAAADPVAPSTDDRHVRELPGSARPHLTLTVPIATALPPARRAPPRPSWRAGSRSPPPRWPPWSATRWSRRSSSTRRAAPSTSVSVSTPSRPASAPPSPTRTATAPSAAASAHRAGARSTTSSATPPAAARASATEPCCAATTTATSTVTGGAAR